MNPLLKTDVWAVVNAVQGIDVAVVYRSRTASDQSFVDRLRHAADYIGVEQVNIFFDRSNSRYAVGRGSVRIGTSGAGAKELVVHEFEEDDFGDIVHGKSIFDHASEKLDYVDPNDEGLTEHYFEEDDENDTYGIDRRPDYERSTKYVGQAFTSRRMWTIAGAVGTFVTVLIILLS
jgi:hypothetical protein